MAMHPRPKSAPPPSSKRTSRSERTKSGRLAKASRRHSSGSLPTHRSGSHPVGRASPSHRPDTHGLFGERKLLLLCNGLGLSRDESDKALRVFRGMTESWAREPLGATPRWQSDLTDDGSPFEFSIAFDGATPRLRILVENHEGEEAPLSSWNAGLKLQERLRRLPNVDLRRFDEVVDLFAPAQGVMHRFTLWHGAVLDPEEPTTYKAYLNPQVRGEQAAMDVTLEALSRLNMPAASQFIRSLHSFLEPSQYIYFSLDLSNTADARAKVYIAHPSAVAADVETSLQHTEHYVAGEVQTWIRHLLGGDGPFQRRPIITCLAFTSSGRPPAFTLHVPIRDYTSNDEVSVERACKFLNPSASAILRRALRAFACRRLEEGRTLLTYVSLRRGLEGPHVTAYVAPEAFLKSGRLGRRNSPRS